MNSATSVNSDPTGTVTLSGIPLPGRIVSVVTTLADADGLGTFVYQWQTDGEDIAGATGTNYLVTAADLGKYLSVVLSYTDGYGTLESVASEPYGVVDVTTVEHTKAAITTVVPDDALLGARPKFTLSGDDADLFRISSKGVLTFISAHDYEVHDDWDGDGVYQVSVDMTNARTHYSVTRTLLIGVEFAAIQGTAANDTLRGTNGWDTLDGLGGNDKLTGRAGLDTFHIGAGSDTITDFNLLGDDFGQEVLQVEAGARVVATLASEDWFATADSCNLGAAELRTKGLDVDLSEIIAGLGWSVLNTGKDATLTGSMFADVLTAGSGNDILHGGDGNDLLIGNKLADVLDGGAGADRFRLNGNKGVTTAHILTDFVSGQDRIELDTRVFKAVGAGQLTDAVFVAGTAAQNARQHVIYDRATGHLLYDADGSGKAAAVLIGVLSHDTVLHASDIVGI